MKLEVFVKNWQRGDGRTRVINSEGEVVAEHFDPSGGDSIDFVSAEWAIKQGQTFKKEQHNSDTFRFFKR